MSPPRPLMLILFKLQLIHTLFSSIKPSQSSSSPLQTSMLGSTFPAQSPQSDHNPLISHVLFCNPNSLLRAYYSIINQAIAVIIYSIADLCCWISWNAYLRNTINAILNCSLASTNTAYCAS